MLYNLHLAEAQSQQPPQDDGQRRSIGIVPYVRADAWIARPATLPEGETDALISPSAELGILANLPGALDPGLALRYNLRGTQYREPERITYRRFYLGLPAYLSWQWNPYFRVAGGAQYDILLVENFDEDIPLDFPIAPPEAPGAQISPFVDLAMRLSPATALHATYRHETIGAEARGFFGFGLSLNLSGLAEPSASRQKSLEEAAQLADSIRNRPAAVLLPEHRNTIRALQQQGKNKQAGLLEKRVDTLHTRIRRQAPQFLKHPQVVFVTSAAWNQIRAGQRGWSSEEPPAVIYVPVAQMNTGFNIERAPFFLSSIRIHDPQTGRPFKNEHLPASVQYRSPSALFPDEDNLANSFEQLAELWIDFMMDHHRYEEPKAMPLGSQYELIPGALFRHPQGP